MLKMFPVENEEPSPPLDVTYALAFDPTEFSYENFTRFIFLHTSFRVKINECFALLNI